MSDYKLTAGQQQQLISFLNAGKGLYIEGNDFGYYHKADPLYKMFGVSWGGDGAPSYNVQTLYGEQGTLFHGTNLAYTYGTTFPDQYVDELVADGGKILCKCQKGKGRVVAYAGPDGTYRAIHSSFWLGALKNSNSSYSKAEIMAAYMRYLQGDSLVVGLGDEVSAGQASQAHFFLEAPASEAGREFVILGSASGTSPGIPVGSVVLPLNYDVLTSLVISLLNTAAFAGFKGNLDSEGHAMATLDTLGPMNPAAVGVTMHYAYLLRDPVDFASNAAAVPIVN